MGELRKPCVILFAACAISAAGCTFVTSCPPTGGTPPAGNAGSSGTAGSGSAGDSNVVSGEVPPGEWTVVTPDFKGLELTCGPAVFLSSKPDEDMVLVGVGTLGVWATQDGGMTWDPLGTGKDSDPMVHGTTSVAYDPEHHKVFWETGAYGNGLFQTTDDGVTFKHLGDSFHNDFVSVDFTDPKRQTLLLSTHESQNLLKSTDGGDTFKDISAGIPKSANVCNHPLILDGQTYLLGCGGGSDPGMPMILRSTDRGESWTQTFDHGGVGAPLVASDGSIYWSEEQNQGLVRSTDQGQTWTQVTPQYVLLNQPPVELPDGRIAALTTTGFVVSADHGATWKRASSTPPYTPTGFVYSPFQKAFFIYYLVCYANPSAGPPNAVMRFDFDYETQ